MDRSRNGKNDPKVKFMNRFVIFLLINLMHDLMLSLCKRRKKVHDFQFKVSKSRWNNIQNQINI